MIDSQHMSPALVSSCNPCACSRPRCGRCWRDRATELCLRECPGPLVRGLFFYNTL